MKLKVLILGKKGTLGSNLFKYFKQKKNFYVIDHHNTDFSKLKNCKNLIKNKKPHYIINCAALTNLEICEKNKKKAYQSNVKIVKNLASICKNKIKLIHFSTDQLYNFIKNKNTESKHKIYNYYSKTKFLSELEAIKCNALIFRTNFFFYDPTLKKGLISWLIQNSKKGVEIKFYKDIFFSPLYLKTLCKIIYKVFNKKKSGVYNLGTKNSISKSNFLILISKKLKLKIKYKITNYPRKSFIKRPKNMSMNIKKFEKDFKLNLPFVENEIRKIK